MMARNRQGRLDDYRWRRRRQLREHPDWTTTLQIQHLKFFCKLFGMKWEKRK